MQCLTAQHYIRVYNDTFSRPTWKLYKFNNIFCVASGGTQLGVNYCPIENKFSKISLSRHKLNKTQVCKDLSRVMLKRTLRHLRSKKDSNHAVCHRSLIRAFLVCMFTLKALRNMFSEKRKLRSAWANAQADLRSRLSHRQKGTLFRDTGPLIGCRNISGSSPELISISNARLYDTGE